MHDLEPQSKLTGSTVNPDSTETTTITSVSVSPVLRSPTGGNKQVPHGNPSRGSAAGSEAPALDRPQSAAGSTGAAATGEETPDSAPSGRRSARSPHPSAGASSSPREKRRSSGLDSPRVKRQLRLVEDAETPAPGPARATPPPMSAAGAAEFYSPGGPASVSGSGGVFETPSPPSRRRRASSGNADAARDEPQPSTSGRDASENAAGAPAEALFSPDPSRMTLDEVASWDHPTGVWIYVLLHLQPGIY